MNKERLQFIVVIVIVVMWVIGIVLSIFDGSVLAKAMTPLLTMVFGWLFTQKATA